MRKCYRLTVGVITFSLAYLFVVGSYSLGKTAHEHRQPSEVGARALRRREDKGLQPADEHFLYNTKPPRVIYRTQSPLGYHVEQENNADIVSVTPTTRTTTFPFHPIKEMPREPVCLETMLATSNKAELQVSSMVEELSFELEDGGSETTAFPELKPLPYSEPLRVFLVPHTHCDPGWLETYQRYYELKVRWILTWLYIKAVESPDFKYIYAEVSFFKLWWEEQDEDIRNGMRRLAREGRFEFVQGGWVQTDEANTHYFAMMNEMLDGHQWLKEHFPEAMPRAGWAIDPFGLSPVMAYVNKLFGLSAMHIQRVHYSIKNHLARTRNLDFHWRQSWDKTGITDIQTHLGPFFSYSLHNTCGPDALVCKSFNYMRYREKEVTDKSPAAAATIAKEILEQWRLKAALHRTGTIFVELGDDFSYSLKEHTHGIYDNYKIIMDIINANSDFNTKVSWGVLSDYFDHVKGSYPTATLPTLSGDFFTYADQEADYWSGYYTSRPFYKNLDRVLESMLRRTEILFSFHRNATALPILHSARQTLSLFQHHDGITGTARGHVVEDYGGRLFEAYQGCKSLLSSGISHLLGLETTPTTHRLAFNVYEKDRPVRAGEVVVFNSLPRDLTGVHSIAVQGTNTYRVLGEGVVQQIEPNYDYGKIDRSSSKLVFSLSTPSISLTPVILVAGGEDSLRVRIETYNSYRLDEHLTDTFWNRDHPPEKCQPIEIGSERAGAKLDCRSGTLLELWRGGVRMGVKQNVVLYDGTNSGAYLFRPDGHKELLGKDSRPAILVLKGPVRHKAIVRYDKYLTVSFTVHLVEGPEGEYVDMELLTTLKILGEMVARFATDLDSKQTLFTDLNGHTIQEHRYKEKLQLQGNFFPMPSTAFIQDDTRRFTILSTEPHGVASTIPGGIEVVLDRMLQKDDERGLAGGVTDNLPTPGKLRLLLEERPLIKEALKAENQGKSSAKDYGYKVEFPSLLSHLSQQTLLHPPYLFHSNKPVQKHPDPVQLMRPFPCDTELVNLRYMSPVRSLMITRALGPSCEMGTTDFCPVDVTEVGSETFLLDTKVDVSPGHLISPFHETPDQASDRPMEFQAHYVHFPAPKLSEKIIPELSNKEPQKSGDNSANLVESEYSHGTVSL